MTHINVESTGWDTDGLNQVLEFAKACHSAQLVIRHRGGVLVSAEFDSAPVDVYAVQKGLVSILFGIAEKNHWLKITDSINQHLRPSWTRLAASVESSLSIQDLLKMLSGMDDELKELGSIGETWRYNNTAYNYLKKILGQRSGLTLNQLSRKWLFDPLGMDHSHWEDREALLPDGTPLSGLMSTASDLADFGLMVLNQGDHDGNSLVPKDYIDRLALPGSTENPAWGLCWWNNNQDQFRVPMREQKVYQGNIIPGAPRDLIAARGALENGLYIVPSLDLVIARTTLTPADNTRPARFEREFWALLMKARLSP